MSGDAVSCITGEIEDAVQTSRPSTGCVYDLTVGSGFSDVDGIDQFLLQVSHPQWERPVHFIKNFKDVQKFDKLARKHYRKLPPLPRHRFRDKVLRREVKRKDWEDVLQAYLTALVQRDGIHPSRLVEEHLLGDLFATPPLPDGFSFGVSSAATPSSDAGGILSSSLRKLDADSPRYGSCGKADGEESSGMDLAKGMETTHIAADGGDENPMSRHTSDESTNMRPLLSDSAKKAAKMGIKKATQVTQAGAHAVHAGTHALHEAVHAFKATALTLPGSSHNEPAKKANTAGSSELGSFVSAMEHPVDEDPSPTVMRDVTPVVHFEADENESSPMVGRPSLKRYQPGHTPRSARLSKEHKGTTRCLSGCWPTRRSQKAFSVYRLAPETSNARRCFADRFEEKQKLGAGVGGATYLVKHRSSGWLVVAKRIAHETLSKKEIQEFREEFEIMRRLQHPNVARVYELIISREPDIGGPDRATGKYKQQINILMEYARGGDLLSYMGKAMSKSSSTDGAGPCFSYAWVANVMRQAMCGVAYLHRNDIFHGDLKPDNILVMNEFREEDSEPEIVIADFGCSQLVRGRQLMLGDPRYMAPELWDVWSRKSQPNDVDKLAGDVWAMGVTSFELLSGGFLPFFYGRCKVDEALNDPEILRDLETCFQQASPSTLKVREYCGEGLACEAEALLHKMLTKDPKERADAPQVLKQLDAWRKTVDVEKDLTQRTLDGLQFVISQNQAHRIILLAIAAKMETSTRRELWKVFDQIDTDHTGHIVRKDFLQAWKQILKKEGQEFTEEEQQEAILQFEEADIDKDNRLSFNEFFALAYRWEEMSHEALKKELQKLVDSLAPDGEGQVTEEEFKKLFGGSLTLPQLKQTFKCMDQNGDGKVDLTELQAFLLCSYRTSTTSDIDKRTEPGCADVGHWLPPLPDWLVSRH
mmetsp:Transcript_14880/g.33895  ORF Transcript_14880/g.33895 Transcript_14880/m.33895 type:complete len:930 (-) Transcript_14880:19-2808(-)